MAKRMNGEGNLRRRADGRWEYRAMDGYLEDGRRNIITFYGRTQKEVREKVKAYQDGKAAGISTGTMPGNALSNLSQGGGQRSGAKEPCPLCGQNALPWRTKTEGSIYC